MSMNETILNKRDSPSSRREQSKLFQGNSLPTASTPFDDCDKLAEKQAELGKHLPFVAPHPADNRIMRRLPRSSDPPVYNYSRNSSASNSMFTGSTSNEGSNSSVENTNHIDVQYLEGSYNSAGNFLSKDDLELESDDIWLEDASTAALNQSLGKKQWDVSFTAVQDSIGVPCKILARQLALINAKSFKAVTRAALESLCWVGPEKWKKAPSIANMIQQFNQITLWVSHEILETNEIKQRWQKISRFIDLAKACLQLNDFNGAKCIISGLESSPVHRLEKTWAMLPRSERVLYDKIKDLLSPNDNFSKYRRRLRRAPMPLIPFLGVHLGDLVYLNEAKKKELSKSDLEAARQRDSQIARLIDQLQTFQAKCNYEFEEIPPVKALLVQEKFISELQNFLEDHQFQLSYQLESRKGKDMSVFVVPSSSAATPSSLIHEEFSSVNNDLLSLSIDNYKRSLSIDTIGTNDGDRETHARETSQGSSTSSSKSAPKLPDVKPSNNEKPVRQGQSLSLGQKRGLRILKQAAAIHEDGDTASWLKDEALVNIVGSVQASLDRDRLTTSASSIEKGRKIRSATHSPSHSVETADIFGNKFVLKESVLLMKIKRDINGKKSSNRHWDEYWTRLFPGVIICLPKKPLSATDKNTNAITFDIKENTIVEVASYYKKKPHVFKLKPMSPIEIMFQAKNEQEMYEWVAIIQKTSKRNSLSR